MNLVPQFLSIIVSCLPNGTVEIMIPVRKIQINNVKDIEVSTFLEARYQVQSKVEQIFKSQGSI